MGFLGIRHDNNLPLLIVGLYKKPAVVPELCIVTVISDRQLKTINYKYEEVRLLAWTRVSAAGGDVYLDLQLQQFASYSSEFKNKILRSSRL